MSSSDRQFGAVTVVVGDKNGKYPHGNSLWIRGRASTAVVDPSLSVVARAAEFAGRADLVVLSHAHEDHLAGVHLFPQARVHAHRADALGVRSLAGLLTIYGYEHFDAEMGTFVTSQFHYAPRRDVEGFEDGAVFDLGDVRIRAIHTPGHTRGHCVLLVEPDGQARSRPTGCACSHLAVHGRYRSAGTRSVRKLADFDPGGFSS